MSRNVTVAAVQMQCSTDRAENLAKAEAMIREAAKNGAQIILLPELFERQYFCQERRYEYYDFAEKTEENAAVRMCMKLAGELSVVLPVSFYERDGSRLFNSAAVIDADGSLLGVYRKTHIPDDHYYQEKFYFAPGNTGFTVWQTRYAAVGIGICWDQWFPETARSLVLNGAEMLFYPTAIGSEPILDTDSEPHWQTCMQGHAACNITPVIAANRIGLEEVMPCPENGGQRSALKFYGSSFIANTTGQIVQQADRVSECVIAHTFDLDAAARDKLDWGLFRDRRPHCYTPITNA
ncbi:MAG: N-carbamoylputrescine amidase [Oscillospiraceae bacterium]|nr:N-carbamoylputrescine amidase [Oscillospiraceae bacterium]